MSDEFSLLERSDMFSINSMVEPEHCVGSPAADPSYGQGELAALPPDNTRRLGSSAFAGSLAQYEATLQGLGELDITTQDSLVEVVSRGLAAETVLEDAPLPEELFGSVLIGQGAQQQLALALAGRVVNIAHWNCNKISKWDIAFLQDTMQTGMLALVESIVSYARLPEEKRHAFWPYAQAAVTNKVREACREYVLGKSINRNNNETNDLGRYFTARRNFINQQGRTPSDEEMAIAMKKTREEIYAIRMWATPTHSIRQSSSLHAEESRDLIEHIPENRAAGPSNEKAEILVERALEFLTPAQQTMMRMRFGIGDEPVMTAGEIARKLGASESNVSYAFGRDLATLKGIIQRLRSCSINYEEMRIKRNVRSVLTILNFADAPAPDNARLPELRQLALSCLDQVVKDERERKVICGLYGLDSGSRAMHQELAVELGMSKSNIGNVEARVLGRLKAGLDRP